MPTSALSHLPVSMPSGGAPGGNHDFVNLPSHSKLVTGSREAQKGEIRTQEDDVKRKFNGKQWRTTFKVTGGAKNFVILCFINSSNSIHQIQFKFNSNSVSSNSSNSTLLSSVSLFVFKQRLKQWSPDESDHGLINNNSSIDATGLHSTLYSTPFSPLLSPMLQSPGTAPLFAPCSTSPLPTFSSKPPVDFYKPATQRVKPLMKGDLPVSSEHSTDVGGSHAKRLPSAKVMCIIYM